MDLRPISYVVGIFLLTLAAAMAVPIAFDLYFDHPDWKVFFVSSLITSFVGALLVFTNRHGQTRIDTQQAFVMTVLCWVTLSIAGAIPFYFSALDMDATDALFESISGLTTTGSTVMTNLEAAPPGILIWRAMLQWLGGIGIIVMALSVLPFLKVGGMQLFRTESSESEKVLPKATTLAANITGIYIMLTTACYLFYLSVGLTPFDALAHSMTTIATGGYSTHDLSMGYYSSAGPSIVAIAFMILGGLPFVLYLQAVRGNLAPLFRDSQVRWFISIILLATAVAVFYLTLNNQAPFWDALRISMFNMVSLITGTGYSNADYASWGPFIIGLSFFIMVIGGCAGSTTCGIKIFRIQILYSIANNQMKQLIYPHGVFVPRYNGKPIPRGAAGSVLSFFFLYAICFTGLAIALSFTGLDFLTAMSGAATSISNVGPGLGDIIGPSGTFSPLPDTSKWILCVGMILGRLELFTLLIMLSPAFWKR